MRRHFSLAGALALAAPAGLAQTDGLDHAGVKVGKMSSLRNLVSEQQTESQSLPLYASAKKTSVAALPPYRSNLQGLAPLQ
jgi:hypothetical protein